MGKFSNDPECLCSDVSVDGVGFIGYFNEGIPTGFGWKGVFGGIGNGAWIYGEVDSQGDFTGELVFNLFTIMLSN